jgi:hypothetical protein
MSKFLGKKVLITVRKRNGKKRIVESEKSEINE